MHNSRGYLPLSLIILQITFFACFALCLSAANASAINETPVSPGLYVIGRKGQIVPEAQVADGQTAGLLGVVCKVALCEHVGVVADDLDEIRMSSHKRT